MLRNSRKAGRRTKSSGLALAPPYSLLLQTSLNIINTDTASKSTLSSFPESPHPDLDINADPQHQRCRHSRDAFTTLSRYRRQLILQHGRPRTRQSVINPAISCDLKFSFPNHGLLRSEHSKPRGPSSAQYYTPSSRAEPSSFSGASFHAVTRCGG
jgi:hypothetical protein